MGNTIGRSIGAGLAAGALLFVGACGGSGGSSDSGRPSTTDLTSAITKTGDSSLLGNSGAKLTGEAASCLAKAMHDSDISDAGLRAIIKGDKDYKASSADEKAAASMIPDLQKCVPTPAQ
jgi:hypothetical protein